MRALVITQHHPSWPRTTPERALSTIHFALSRLVLEGSRPVRGCKELKLLLLGPIPSSDLQHDLEITIVFMPDPDAEAVAGPVADNMRGEIRRLMELDEVQTSLSVSSMVSFYTTTVGADDTVHTSADDGGNHSTSSTR